MPFSRVRCHFCGRKQPYSKSVMEFQCSHCEAVNFLDGKGNVVDTPASIAAQFTPEPLSTMSYTRPLPETLEHQSTPAFCRTCVQNQLLYNESLAHYLPDESHPEYKKYERALPQFKLDLEQRYPLVCKKCAPLVQSKINRADYFGMTQNAARLCAATKARGGMPAYRTRDDMSKKAMRATLRLVGVALYLGMLAQLVFHAYGILNAILGTGTLEPEFTAIDDDTEGPSDPSIYECTQQALNLRFTSSCYSRIGESIPLTLVIAMCGLFYNPGLESWYHHTQRIEAINGQRNYLYIQAIMLGFRSWVWYSLSSSNFVAKFETDQIIGFHALAIFCMLLAQGVANHGIEPVVWKMKGKMMPRPDEIDMLSANAGPEVEHHVPQVSEKDPWRYLRSTDNGPLDINDLAPNAQKKGSYSRTSRSTTQQPSPDVSDGTEDAMETDDQPVMRSSQRYNNGLRSHLQPRNAADYHTGSSIGFGGMTDEVFNIDTQIREELERERLKQQQKLHFQQPEPSPFRGTLPPAPMSMERRMRNPISQPAQPLPPQHVPLSQQKNFMAQMRAGVKPVQFAERGSNFELKKSDWILPGDVKELGLEDRFSKTFTLADPSPAGAQQKTKGGLLGGLFGI